MTEDKHNNSEKASRKRPPKDRHIDVRFTEDEFNHVLKNAQFREEVRASISTTLPLGIIPLYP